MSRSDEPSFRAYDLNLALSPTREMCGSPDDLRACFTDSPEYRRAGIYRCRYWGVGVGFGGGRLLAGVWRVADLARVLATCRDLDARGRRDGTDYRAMERRRRAAWCIRAVWCRSAEFVEDVEADLHGAPVFVASSDGYKSEELRGVCPWPLEIVRSGSGPDGSAARCGRSSGPVLKGTLRAAPNLSLTSAIAESTIRRDGNGNPAVDQARARGRIDVLSAAILAVGGSGEMAAAGPDGRLHPQRVCLKL